MQVLWLRYLTEIDEKTKDIPQELMDNPQIKKAVTQLEESAFSDSQLLGYDYFWDAVRVEKTLINDGIRKGMQQGFEQGMQQGLEEGIQQGREEGILQGREEGIIATSKKNAATMKAKGLSMELIAEITGLSPEIIANL